MGITLASLHIFSADPVDPALGRFHSFSKGWQTMLPSEEGQEIDWSPSFLRALSKKAAAPVLMFSIFDSDEVFFSIHEQGKQRAYFSTFGYEGNKGIFQIPGLVGYPDGYKRRISEILSCPDAELLTALLEEFFGVALLVDEEIIATCPEELERSKGETGYLAFHESQKKLRGKHAPIRAVLTQELHGKLFTHAFGRNGLFCPPGYFLFGYHYDGFPLSDLRMMRFANGRLEEADAEMVPEEPQINFADLHYEWDVHPPQKTVTFTGDCPDVYKGKTFTIPEGFYPFAFDSKQRFVLCRGRSVAFMNPEGELIARLSLKGEPAALIDDYLLTAGAESFYAFVYDPKEYIRIYRLEDQ